MARMLLLALILIWLPGVAGAQDWLACHGTPGSDAPVLSDCRPVEGVIDPQGRELWLRAVVARPTVEGPQAFYIGGTASSEVWLNGRRLGANGRPGASAKAEVPGTYQAVLPIGDSAWRAENELVVRMSSFHGGFRLDAPIAGLGVYAYPMPSRPIALAATFAAAGALLAAAFGYGVIHALRRTGSSLMLAAMAGVAGLQAILESLRTLVTYAIRSTSGG